MKKDELQGETHEAAARRRYREKTGQSIEAEQARELERADDLGRGRTVDEDRLLRDEDDERSQLPR